MSKHLISKHLMDKHLMSKHLMGKHLMERHLRSRHLRGKGQAQTSVLLALAPRYLPLLYTDVACGGFSSESDCSQTIAGEIRVMQR